MSVGRFQVMALLQAARAHVLGLDEGSARSWGLNRAIFYAAAKRGFASTPQFKTRGEVGAAPARESAAEFFLGDEKAYKAESESGSLRFRFGGKTQTDEEFNARIKSRFGERFDEAWSEAIELMQEFDKDTLMSQNRFFEQVYKPRRDELAGKWSENGSSKRKTSRK